MTANAVVSPLPSQPPRRQPTTGATAMVRLVRESWARIEARQDEPAGSPPSWPAQVADHQRLNWDRARVRVQPDYPVPYQAGQYLSVEGPRRQRLWRYLTPANAPREDGIIEFHVRGVAGGWVSRSV